MNKQEINTILQITDLALKYGVPAVSNAINKTDKKVITENVIKNLKIDKQWEDYFDKKIKDTVKNEVNKQSQSKNTKSTKKKATEYAPKVKVDESED